jgi:hypothetical protein
MFRPVFSASDLGGSVGYLPFASTLLVRANIASNDRCFCGKSGSRKLDTITCRTRANPICYGTGTWLGNGAHGHDAQLSESDFGKHCADVDWPLFDNQTRERTCVGRSDCAASPCQEVHGRVRKQLWKMGLGLN